MTGQGAPSIGPSGVTEAVAARYREILPKGCVVEAKGPILSTQLPGCVGSVFFGNFILRFPFLGAEYRLEEFAKMAFGRLPGLVSASAKHVKGLEWPAIGTTCHVRVTADEVRIWYGNSDIEEEAVLKVRPIPRSELGL